MAGISWPKEAVGQCREDAEELLDSLIELPGGAALTDRQSETIYQAVGRLIERLERAETRQYKRDLRAWAALSRGKGRGE